MPKSLNSKTIRIDSLAAGGDGVGRLRGKVCFVPLSAPGDLLRVRVGYEAKDFTRCKIDEILEPGPGRVEPPCPLFGRCGGCQWLHISIDEQKAAKRQILARALELDEVEIVPSPEQLGYRRLARLHYDSKEGALGFAMHRQRKLVDVAACPALTPMLDNLLEPTKAQLLSCLEGRAEVRLGAGLDGAVALIESVSPLSPEFYSKAADLVDKTFKGVLVSIDGLTSTVAGQGFIKTLGGDGEQLIEPASSFGQANSGVNRLLGQTVAKWVEKGRFSSALELFAGAGNLTVAIAPHTKKTATVESDGRACQAAWENVSGRGLKKVTIHAGDAAEVYSSIEEKFELVVLDPPRTGHRDLARAIKDGSQRAVLYVSCNPATLWRDLKELKSGGFGIVEALGFDMFPMTAHIEAAVLMER